MTKEITIEGMSCGHCAKHVEDELKSVSGVKSVKVDLEGKSAKVELDHEVDDGKLKAAVEEAGYKATNVK